MRLFHVGSAGPHGTLMNPQESGLAVAHSLTVFSLGSACTQLLEACAAVTSNTTEYAELYRESQGRTGSWRGKPLMNITDCTQLASAIDDTCAYDGAQVDQFTAGMAKQGMQSNPEPDTTLKLLRA